MRVYLIGNSMREIDCLIRLDFVDEDALLRSATTVFRHGGFRVPYHASLNFGSRVLAAISVSGDCAPILISGVVAWSAPAPNGYMIGLAFDKEETHFEKWLTTQAKAGPLGAVNSWLA